MELRLSETYGKLLLGQLFTHVWFGEWDQYEDTIDQIPNELVASLPFHKYYDRDETSLWHYNYFSVPGVYFVPPYISSYQNKTEEDQNKTKQDLLCLIGAFDKVGFYYPLEKNEFPDHIGSLTAFIVAATKEEITALKNEDFELLKQLEETQTELYDLYLDSGINKLWNRHKRKFADPFFKTFLPFYMESMKVMVC